MRKIATIGIFLFMTYSSSVFCQVKGKIVDTQQQPIEGATIVMQLPDSTYVETGLSVSDGTFILNQQPKEYILIIQHLF